MEGQVFPNQKESRGWRNGEARGRDWEGSQGTSLKEREGIALEELGRCI